MTCTPTPLIVNTINKKSLLHGADLVENVHCSEAVGGDNGVHLMDMMRDAINDDGRWSYVNAGCTVAGFAITGFNRVGANYCNGKASLG